MTTSDIISVGSLLVAVFSVAYARRAYAAARVANDIAIHSHRLQIYKEFDALRFAMVQHGDGITHEDTARFYFPSRDAEFYFADDIYERLRRYFEICSGLADIHKETQKPSLPADERRQFYEEQSRLRSDERTLAAEIDSLLRQELKVVGMAQLYPM